jgi:SAM-dependent methyltransferase
MVINNILNLMRPWFPKKLWKTGAAIKNNYLKQKYLKGKRPYAAGETTKAKDRRIREGFFENYCNGKGLDIGYGGDLIVPDATGWDYEHGDAQYLRGVADESYDFVYSSHTLEHVRDAGESLKNWFRVLKPGGYLIIYIPHRDLYEKKKTLPSRFNADHKRFFLPLKNDPPHTVGIVPLINDSLENHQIIYCKECSEGHTISDPDRHSDGEFSIEVVIKKLL